MKWLGKGFRVITTNTGVFKKVKGIYGNSLASYSAGLVPIKCKEAKELVTFSTRKLKI